MALVVTISILKLNKKKNNKFWKQSSIDYY